MKNHRKRVQILKIKRHNARKELDFELDYQLSLSTAERFRMMISRSRQIAQMLLNNGYIKPFEIVKRP
jgi:hypothetical protein